MITKESGRDPRCRTNGWGIDLAYEDALGNWHDTSSNSEAAILQAMDAGQSLAAHSDPVIVMHSGENRAISGRGLITLESGEQRAVSDVLPRDLPHGYHRLHLEGSGEPTP